MNESLNKSFKTRRIFKLFYSRHGFQEGGGEKMNFSKKIVPLFILFLSVCLLSACHKHYREIPVHFKDGENSLSGALILPKNSQEPFPVVVFVHGDGARPYDVYGYYRPLWKRLAEQGIASFSWDKAGIGGSKGDWESQSMEDRANEVIAAIDHLKKRPDIVSNKVGVIGYSQAGWVLPLVAKKSNYPDFMVLISTAINWMDQGDYMTKIRLTQKGFSDAQIQREIEQSRKVTKQLFSPSATYEAYRQYYHSGVQGDTESMMTPQRFQFVKLNWRSDARESLKEIHVPTLAVFGDSDLNVDVFETIRVYKKIFSMSGNKELTIKVFSGAEHGLLKQEYFQEPISGIGFVIKLELLGEDAFAEGYLDFVTHWIKTKTTDY